MDAPHDGQSLPPAGWFTDPQNADQERWWDGAQWTDYRRSRVAGPRPAGNSSLGRTAAIVGIVAGGLLVLGVLLLLLGGFVTQLRFLLFVGILAFFGTFLCGMVAVILSIVAGARRS